MAQKQTPSWDKGEAGTNGHPDQEKKVAIGRPHSAQRAF